MKISDKKIELTLTLDANQITFRPGNVMEDYYYMQPNPPILVYQHQCAINDKNGNPRKLWIAWNSMGTILKVQDEKYKGKPKWKGIQITTVEITVAEYQETLKYAKNWNLLVT